MQDDGFGGKLLSAAQSFENEFTVFKRQWEELWPHLCINIATLFRPGQRSSRRFSPLL